jgi:hypothetical protein
MEHDDQAHRRQEGYRLFDMRPHDTAAASGNS